MKFVDGYTKQEQSESMVPLGTPNLREIFTDRGTIRLERRNPYGFVHVVWYAGVTPAPLSGSYSDFDTAREAVSVYLTANTFDKLQDEAPVKPVLRIKKTHA